MKKEISGAFMCIMAIIFASCEIEPKVEPSPSLLCQPPPDTFSEEDLVGIWQASRPDWRDTIIIHDDGTYQQILHLESGTSTFDYESDWLSWRVEDRESDLPYLHLSGFRVCGYEPEISCDQIGGGNGYWRDYCQINEETKTPLGSIVQSNWIKMTGEGIMVIMAASRTNEFPKGIVFSPLGKNIYGTWVYYPDNR